MKSKTEKNILIAFLLNLSFSVIEFVGGIITGSVAIVSDSVHDLGDAMSIGASFFLEKKSKKAPDEKYTYGYMRYSVLGSVITTVILLFGSLAVIYNAVERIIKPVEINYDGMIVFAVIGAAVNFLAAYFTKEGDSLYQKAVNLHMLEDVLGWVVVLVGAVIMRFTDITIIDPLMSVGVAVFILVNSLRNLKEVLNIFLEKTPEDIDLEKIRAHICSIDGVSDVHHIHLRSLDGYSNYITMHVVATGNSHEIKHKVREELSEHGINHATIELEEVGEHCHEKECRLEHHEVSHHHHHHHH